MVSKILIADDHNLFRESLLIALKAYFPNTALLEAETGEQTLGLAQRKNPDVILLDIDMPAGNGIQTLKRLKKENIESKVIMLTAKQAKEFIYIARQCNASGYLTKRTSVETLAEVIQRVTTSNLFVCSEWFSLDFNSKENYTKNVLSKIPLLTKREREVLNLFFDGYNTKEVAYRLNIRKKSVDNYKNRILSKLEVSEEIYFLDWVIKNQDVLRFVI